MNPEIGLKSKILLIDDNPEFLSSVCDVISREGKYEIQGAADAKMGLMALSKTHFDLVLLDLRLPETSGLELLRILRQRFPELPIVMLTGDTDIRSAIEAMKAGATEYVTKGEQDLLVQINFRVEQALEKARSANRSRKMEEKLKRQNKEKEIVGVSHPILKLKTQIMSLRGYSTTVHITGESGAGKELVAQALHAQEQDSAVRPLVNVNCATIPEHLIESELFGHEKGSFTGAIGRSEGKFLAANGGDIFLDEIGELPLSMQAKLLRVLEEREVSMIGSSKVIPIQVRVITGTNRNLDEEVKAGRFREDLYYRIKVMELRVPPLRERKEDIPLLITHFLKSFHSPHLKLSSEALLAVAEHSWPGNIRSLKNMIERACIFLKMEGRTTIEKSDLVFDQALAPSNQEPTIPKELLPISSDRISSSRYREFMSWAERTYFDAALETVTQNRTRLSQLMGMSRSFVQERLKAVGITSSERREVRVSG